MCDTCGRSYSNRRNLNRHVKEKHLNDVLYFKCPVSNCNAKLIRRGYLTKHLEKVHGMDKPTVKLLVSEAILTTERARQQRTPLTELCTYEEISDVEPVSDDTHPCEDVSEFENWLDSVLDTDANVLSETTTSTENRLEAIVGNSDDSERIVTEDIGDDPDIHVELSN